MPPPSTLASATDQLAAARRRRSSPPPPLLPSRRPPPRPLWEQPAVAAGCPPRAAMSSSAPSRMSAPRGCMAVRHSIAPRVLDNSVPMNTLTSTARFSVRVQPGAGAAGAAAAGDGAPILATFVWKDNGAHVQLAGSFDDWRKHDMTFVPGVGYFVLVVELPPGEYYYRFVVDGRWRVAEGDSNLREDPFGEMSHFLSINARALEATTPNRFSTAAITQVALSRDSASAPVPEDQRAGHDVDADSIDSSEEESSDEDTDPGTDDDDDEDGDGEERDGAQPSATTAFPQFEPERLPRHKGEEFVADYCDDEFGDLDLQADVHEAMFDVKEEVSESQTQSLLLPPAALARRKAREAAAQRQARTRRPTKRLMRNVFAKLFGKDLVDDNAVDPDAPDAEAHGYAGLPLASPDILRQVEDADRAARKKQSRLRIWFPAERRSPTRRGRQPNSQDRAPPEIASGPALRVHQAEENAASRQHLGKALFAQGKYDAALAMFSLALKIRDDNGLRNAKTSAVAHTDVASCFIHLGDLKNADKHLDMALGVYAKKTFSGGGQELGDVYCFRGVIADMRGALSEAEKSYRRAISLYEASGSTRSNPNFETACANLRDNLRRQKNGPSEEVLKQQYEQHLLLQEQQENAKSISRDSSPISTVEEEPEANGKENRAVPQNSVPIAEYHPTPRNAVKSILRQNPGQKPRITAAPPQTLSTINSFPDTMESTAYPPGTNSSSRLSNSQPMDPRSLANAPIHHKSPDSVTLPPTLDEYRETGEHEAVQEGSRGSRRISRRNSRPTTWKALADVARASMPAAPVENSGVDSDDDGADSTVGSYEEMSRGWQRDGRKLLVAGKYTEAIDMYTLAIYTRKRHGPWASKANAETHVEYARALFATKDVLQAAKTLRDAIQILEKLDKRSHDMMRGQVWGNLGSALDKLGGHPKDAETAHSTGLVLFARAGLSKEDPQWTKNWRNLCTCVKAQGSSSKPIEKVWQHIDDQIRGVHPVTSSATIKI